MSSKKAGLIVDSSWGWLLASTDTGQIHSDGVCWRAVRLR